MTRDILAEFATEWLYGRWVWCYCNAQCGYVLACVDGLNVSNITPKDRADVSGPTLIMLLLPISIDVAEVALFLLGGNSWDASVLAVLDIGTTCL